MIVSLERSVLRKEYTWYFLYFNQNEDKWICINVLPDAIFSGVGLGGLISERQQMGGDDLQQSPEFEDEGPSRMISQGREFQRRVWNKGKWFGLPRRLNLRPLADLRAVSAILSI